MASVPTLAKPVIMSQSTTWGYCKHNGPHTWSEVAPIAGEGQHQSPININTSEAAYDEALTEAPIQCTYDAAAGKSIVNNGHTFMINFENTENNLEGGPLSDKYRLLQLHMHWGKTSEAGAEHTIDGKQYAGEIHLVHWNTDKYEDAGAATQGDKGLAVLCIFVEAGDEHSGFQKIVDKLTSIQFSEQKSDLEDGFDAGTLLPENLKEFWTYPGSLTTPPCYETVQFIAFKQPIQVSETQLNALRDMKTFKEDEEPYEDEYEGGLVDNFRPTQEVNDRTVKASFQ